MVEYTVRSEIVDRKEEIDVPAGSIGITIESKSLSTGLVKVSWLEPVREEELSKGVLDEYKEEEK